MEILLSYIVKERSKSTNIYVKCTLNAHVTWCSLGSAICDVTKFYNLREKNVFKSDLPICIL